MNVKALYEGKKAPYEEKKNYHKGEYYYERSYPGDMQVEKSEMLVDEKSLLQFSLIIALVGILLLFFISEFSGPENQSIFEVKKGAGEDETLSIRGIVTALQQKKGLTIINISSYETIPVILYETNNMQDIQEIQNSTVQVIGKVKIFNNKKEIVAEEISIIG